MTGNARSVVVSVVVPTHDRLDKMLRCVASVLSSSDDGTSVEVLVVADRNPRVKPALADSHPGVVVIESAEKLGSQGARALGARAARGEFIFFIDDDNVLSRDCMSTLVRAFRAEPSLGVLGPVSLAYGSTDRIWSAGGRFTIFGLARYLHAGSDLRAARLPELVACDWVPNAYMIRRTLTPQVERVAALFPHIWCEPALCTEARRLGMSVAVTPRAVTWHDVGYTGPLTRTGEGWTAEQARSRIVFRRLYRSGLRSFLSFWALVFPLSSVVYIVRFVRGGHAFREMREYARGTWSGIRSPARYPPVRSAERAR